jgi:CheY-specific phosphatase CheX
VKVEFVNPFLQAATEVLDSELGTESQRVLSL